MILMRSRGATMVFEMAPEINTENMCLKKVPLYLFFYLYVYVIN